MDCLMCRALEAFVRDLHGADAWQAALSAVGLAGPAGGPVRGYADTDAPGLARAAAQRAGQRPEELAGDLGCWLVSHPTTQSIRRLLRFGGQDFAEFLATLEELPGRVALAVPMLRLPAMEVCFAEDGGISIDVAGGVDLFAPVIEGVIRAMADDYGALVFVDRDQADPAGPARLTVRLHDAAFAEARLFRLVDGRAG